MRQRTLRPSNDVISWVKAVVGLGTEVLTVRGMHDGSGPWLLKIEHQQATREVVLRVVGQRDSIGVQPIATGAAHSVSPKSMASLRRG